MAHSHWFSKLNLMKYGMRIFPEEIRLDD